jgi:putrescine transport system substrate-binding protein
VLQRFAFLLLCLVMAAPSAQAAAERTRVLNVYAWSEYFPQSVIERFEKETGIHVNYSVLDSPDVVETALSAGSSNYDIVTMNASPHLAREIPGGFWKKLDPEKIPNARNADPRILKILNEVDPGNLYAVPWMWGSVGVIYNVDAVKTVIGNIPADRLDLVFDKALAAKSAKCGISVLDSWQDVMPMVARYLGQPGLSAESAKLDAVMAKLDEIKPYLRRIATSGYYQQLADGDLCVSVGYSGDAMIARRMADDSHTRIKIDYGYPQGPVSVFVDSMVIPADSPNVAGALQFINFVMRPEISADVVKMIGFASANGAAIPLLDEAVRGNAIIYPPESIRARMQIERRYTSDELRLFGRAWQRFKAGG